jgi:hypothetical protein
MSRKLTSLIGVLVIVGGFYVAWNLIPPYFHNYQLQDELDDIARKNSYTSKTEDEVKQLVIAKARTEGITVKEDQIVVTRTQDGMGISVRYRVHVDMVVRPVDLDFTANSLNKRI